MKGKPNEIITIVVDAKQLVESGALMTSSLLIRGDMAVKIAQDVKFDDRGEYYEMHYRVVSPTDASK